MKDKLIAILNINHSSLLVIFWGISIQIVTWAIMFPVAFAIELDNQVIQIVFGIISLIWLVVPIISIGGIAIALIQIFKRKVYKLPIIGFIANIIWLFLFALVVYFWPVLMSV